MITIIDYGAGNIASIQNMLRRLGHASAVSADPDTVAAAGRLRPISPFKFALLVIGLAALFNAFTSHVGQTRLFTIPGRLPLFSGPVTLEGVVYGAINGLALAGMFAAFALLNQVLPVQALVRMIPPLGNEFIALIKNSALVSLLTIHDLMHEGQKIISVSYRSLEVYLAVALVYFVLTNVTSLALRRASACSSSRSSACRIPCPKRMPRAPNRRSKPPRRQAEATSSRTDRTRIARGSRALRVRGQSPGKPLDTRLFGRFNGVDIG